MNDEFVLTFKSERSQIDNKRGVPVMLGQQKTAVEKNIGILSM